MDGSTEKGFGFRGASGSMFPFAFFSMAKTHSDIGLIGLAVMGQNLALNIADHGFRISVYNRTTEKTEKFVAENPNTPGGLVGAKTLEDFVKSLAKPRKMIILVQAGKATDAVIDRFLSLSVLGLLCIFMCSLFPCLMVLGSVSPRQAPMGPAEDGLELELLVDSLWQVTAPSHGVGRRASRQGVPGR